MTTSLDPVLASLDTVPSRKERLQKAYKELEILSSCSNRWKELEEHFSNVERAVQKRHQDLADKERALEKKVQEMEDALKKREDAVRLREENSPSLVEQQKGLASSTDKRKGQEPKEMPNSAAKIVNTTQPSQAGFDPMLSKDDGDVLNDKVNPLLKLLCEKMDGPGVRNFLEENIKNMKVLNTELPAALKFAENPSHLVLEALKDYPVTEREDKPDENRNFRVSLARRIFVTMLEALTAVLTDPVLGEGHIVVPSDSKDKAKAVAEKWKSEMDIFGDYPDKSVLNAQAFLQLLAAFDLVEHYDEENLCKLIAHIARRKQTPTLCKALRMTHKGKDVVDKLVEQGKQFDALLFAQACGVMDKIQPVPLLKAYLQEAKKSAQEILKSRNSSLSAQNDAGTKEILALKAVLGAISDYKLESKYPSAPLKRRIEELQHARVNRKRDVVATKLQTKRLRMTEPISGGSKVSGIAEGNSSKASDRTKLGRSDLSYTTPGKRNYAHGQVGYSATYGGANKTPISLSRSPSLGSSILGSTLLGSPLYTSPSSLYSRYQFGSGLPPPPPAYQAAFLR